MPNPGVRTAAAQSTRQVYDRGTIILHWLTAVLVVSLFASAETWWFLPRGTALREELQTLHISLGISLAATIIMRIVWRLAQGRRLPPATTGLQAIDCQDCPYRALHFAVPASGTRLPVPLGAERAFRLLWPLHHPTRRTGARPAVNFWLAAQQRRLGDHHYRRNSRPRRAIASLRAEGPRANAHVAREGLTINRPMQRRASSVASSRSLKAASFPQNSCGGAGSTE